MVKELNPNENPIKSPKEKPSGIGGTIESVIKRITENRVEKIKDNENITKLGFVDRLLVKINKFKEGRYDKSIEKLEGKIESIEGSIGEKKKRIEEIENFVKEMGTSSDYMTREKENAKSEEKKLRDKMQELVNKKGHKEGRRNIFIEGRDKIIGPVVRRLEQSMAEVNKNFEELEEEKKNWDIRNEMAENNYKEGTKKLDEMTRMMKEIMGKSHFRYLSLEDMNTIEDRREKLKDNMDKNEKEFIKFKREMEVAKKKTENYQKQINALKVMKGEEKEEVAEGKNEETQEKPIVAKGKNEEAQEKTRSIVEEWEKMSLKDYVEAWKGFLSLNEKGFSEKSVKDFEKIIIKSEVEEINREINFGDFEEKIKYVNKRLELIKEEDWNNTTKDFKKYIIEDKKNKS